SDLANGYQRRAQSSDNCHGSCVKMLQFSSAGGRQQYLDLHGVTIAEPPYHSFVVHGDENTFEMRVEHFKQVGSWYWQTDGPELYTGSRMTDSFVNANDDVLKIYHSGVSIDNTVVWKFENGPVIQWGWGPRNIDGVTVRGTQVIHNRMHPWNHQYNTCVVNSSSHWADMGATNTADRSQTVKNITIEDTVVEGPVNCAISVYAQSNTENILIKNLSIDGWDRPVRSGSEADRNQFSRFEAYTDGSGTPVTIGNEHTQSRGLKLNGYRVGGVSIEKWGGNWQADQRGRLNFSGSLWENWNSWS
ncbi:glycosyl hydrolase family 49, partial [Rarobacter faecitabidus]